MTSEPLKPLSYGVLLFLLAYCLETLFTFGCSGLIDASAIDSAMYLALGAKFFACVAALGFVAGRGRGELAAAGLTLDGAGRGSLRAIGVYLLFLPLFIFVVGPLNNLLVGDEQQAIVRQIMDRPDLLRSIPFLATVCVGCPLSRKSSSGFFSTRVCAFSCPISSLFSCRARFSDCFTDWPRPFRS